MGLLEVGITTKNIKRKSKRMPRHNKQKVHIPYRRSISCDHKKRYQNEIDANDMAELQMLQNPALELSTYKCDLCRYWHLTKQIKKN